MHAINRGFSMIEIIVVIGVISIISLIALGVGVSSFTKGQLVAESEQLVNTLRLAQSYSIAQNQGGIWGVHVGVSSYTLFKGNDYVSRDVAYDQIFLFREGIAASGLTDVVFSARNGVPSDFGVITLMQGTSGDNLTVTVNEQGLITDL